MSPTRPVLTPAELWPEIRKLALAARDHEPLLAYQLQIMVLDAGDLADCLARVLEREAGYFLKQPVKEFSKIYHAHPELVRAAEYDLIAVMERDPAAHSLLMPLLFFKGFQALQAYRIAHHLWVSGQLLAASAMQSAMAKSYTIDIHPAAQIGHGIMMDHAHGIVIGETAVIDNNVSMLHNVTLGGTGKESGDRHPKIRSGVMIGAGAKVLGNIEIGIGARIAAGSVVLEPVPAGVTVAGVPARVVGKAGCAIPAQEMDQSLPIGDIAK